MIKKITICACDVCGTIENAKPAGSQYNETYYSRPNGWTQGASREIDICPECAAKINLKPKMDYGSGSRRWYNRPADARATSKLSGAGKPGAFNHGA